MLKHKEGVKMLGLGGGNLRYVKHGTEGRLRCRGSVRVGERDKVDPEKIGKNVKKNW